ncbi:hypothetical protein ACFCYF_10520 [Streptomyces chartreusis]|uniref:hypothetical protein n=1 Tax=Streptomyces chartreusis TaxID=1969 RepID=UPI002E815A3F|nr:hypothetical protein [Streptomyces chartreusis]WUB17128.1 hypothetical protein OG997_10605 [Streptomyces chartreusis]
MGAGILIIWPVFFFYVLLMGPFCILIGKRTTSRMGWLMSVPLIFVPFAMLVRLMFP